MPMPQRKPGYTTTGYDKPKGYPPPKVNKPKKPPQPGKPKVNPAYKRGK